MIAGEPGRGGRGIGAGPIGLDDNFFELGADSLLAMEMIARAERELGVRIDGMDVLREPLEVIAAICDGRSGGAAGKAARPRGVSGPALEAFYFGGLYGVLHGAGPADAAVVICPPIGQEAVRARFVLSKLARALAARGAPALLFDYFGLGDSEGESAEATPARWRRDVAAASAELVRRTGARRISAIGVRLGATLLAAAEIDAARLVLWDPVVRGADWYAEQAALHRRFLAGQQHLRHGRRPAPIPDGEEQLGVSYSTAAIHQLAALELPRLPGDRIRWLATFEAARQARAYAAIAAPGAAAAGGFGAIEVDCAWRDIARLEETIPDLGIARRLEELVLAP